MRFMKANTVPKTIIQARQKKLALAIALAIASSSASLSSLAADPADQKTVITATTAATHENDLLTLYRQAALSDPVFNSAKYSYLAGKEKLWQGFSVLTPQIAAVGSETKNNLTKKGESEVQLKSRAWSVRLTQPLFNWDKWEQFRQGDLAASIAEAQYAAAEQDLVLRVTEAYFNVLNAQDTLNLARNKKTLIKEQLEQAKRNFEVGTATITGVRDAQARFDLTNAQEIAAENDLRIKNLALDLAVGQSNVKPKRLIDNSKLVDPPKESLENWVSQSEVASPAVRQAQFALDIAKLEVDKAIAGHLPTLDGQIIYSGARNDSGTSTSPTNSLAGNHVLNPSANIVLSVPLFAGLATQYRVRETQFLEEKARSDFENAKRTVAQNTRISYLGLISGLSQVKAYEAAEASTQSALDANKLGYSVGVNINIDVLNAQSQLFQTKRDLAKARYDVLVGNLKLRQAAGTLTPQDLQDINQLLAP